MYTHILKYTGISVLSKPFKPMLNEAGLLIQDWT